MQYGSHFGEEGNRDAAIFIYTLYQMSEHKLPTGAPWQSVGSLLTHRHSYCSQQSLALTLTE
jgi:hypothetical protein